MDELALPLAAAACGAPLLGFFALTGLIWGRDRPREAPVVNISRAAFLVSLMASVTLAAWTARTGQAYVLDAGSWFEVSGHAFRLRFLVDPLSTSMMVLTGGACSLIGHFSRTYLHGDRGLPRFFLLLNVFAVGMMVIVMAGSVDFLFVGWEIVGLTSTLLIGYLHDRAAPVRNGLQAFLTYRATDVGLLVGVILLHRVGHASDLQAGLDPSGWTSGTSAASASMATTVALLFFLSAMGKSAQVPFGGWLPRAMEGPTPSSAIFYGALSVHAGVYLMLRISPLLRHAPLASGVMIAVGAVTALLAMLSGRVQSDVKNALAFATRAQVGLMFVEIGLHLDTLAALHMIGNACLRTWQLLRSPSILREMQGLRGALDRGFETGRAFERLEHALPFRSGPALYQRALDRFYFDAMAVRFVIAPLLRLTQRLAEVDARFVAKTMRDDGPSGGSDPTGGPVPRGVRP